MSFLGWMAVTGSVLLLMALASSYLRHLPISSSALYLCIGLALGPVGLGVARLDVIESPSLVERVAEVAVIVSLFMGGLRLRLRWRDPAWRTAMVLAGPVMLVSITGIAAIAHLQFGLPLAGALLLGAVLAPTDPVLAGAVSVSDAADNDTMRNGLSGEAGLNDGMAFPFVVLALAWDVSGGAGGWLVDWAMQRVVWAIPAALGLGYLLGKLVGRIAIRLRTHQRDTTAPSDLLALALISLAYVSAEAIDAWGFLAVFAAGVGFRAAEIREVTEHPHPQAPRPEGFESVPENTIAHPPAEAFVAARVESDAMKEPAVAAGVLVAETLSFGDTVERIVEVGMIVAVGVALVEHWDPRGVALAAVLFVVIRPLATRAMLGFTATTTPQRWLMGWFGIRGIGSLYYLGYALSHAGERGVGREVIDSTITVIACSVIVHGVTATPLLAWYERRLERATTRPDRAAANNTGRRARGSWRG